MRHQIDENFKSTLMALIQDPFIQSEAGVASLKTILKKPEAERNKELSHVLNESFKDIGLFLSRGRVPEHISKTLGVGGSPTHARLAGFQNYANETNIDTEWLRSFTVADVGPSFTKGEIVDWTNLVTWSEMKYGEEPKAVPLGKEAFAELEEKVYGTAVQLLLRWIETNNLYNINSAFTAIRAAWMTNNASIAYGLLSATAGLPANIVAASASLDDRSHALNLGQVALARANSNKGYGMTAFPTVYAYYAAEIDDIIQAIQNRGIGTNAGNTLVKKSIVFIPTLDSRITTTLNSATNAVLLVLPGLKNFWMKTKGFRSAEVMNVKNESVEIVAFDNFNGQAPAAQRQVVSLL